MSVKKEINDLAAVIRRITGHVEMGPPLLDHDHCMFHLDQAERCLRHLRETVEKKRPAGMEKFVSAWRELSEPERRGVLEMLQGTQPFAGGEAAR